MERPGPARQSHHPRRPRMDLHLRPPRPPHGQNRPRWQHRHLHLG
nr:hypothetical protein [Streptomyces sp. NA02950]